MVCRKLADQAKWYVKNKVVNKTEYDELVANVNAIQTTDTSDLVK